MLYFHPWEFDPDQVRLPLRGLSRYRTYVGLKRTRGRLTDLLTRFRFSRAVDVAEELNRCSDGLPTYTVAQTEQFQLQQ
jgi:hypothetical protein